MERNGALEFVSRVGTSGFVADSVFYRLSDVMGLKIAV